MADSPSPPWLDSPSPPWPDSPWLDSPWLDSQLKSLEDPLIPVIQSGDLYKVTFK